jgi:Tfp pilus assembly PilM family ATPase
MLTRYVDVDAMELLGIDLGSTRIRVALSDQVRGKARLRAIGARDLGEQSWLEDGHGLDFAAAILEQLVRELGLRKRQCVTALGEPHASVRTVRFPKMSWIERRRAARFEVMQNVRQGIVRIHPLDRRTGTYAVAIAQEDVVRRHAELLRKAGLRLLAIDHDAYAFARALPEFDAVADVGYERMRLHVGMGDGVASWTAECGGKYVTSGIASDLSIDFESAERRKRILGTSGAGESAREVCVRELCAMIERVQVRGSAIAQLALVGNAARLPGFAREIAERTSLKVEVPLTPLLRAAGFADDVLVAASPDWTLAAALSTWRAA